MKRSVKMLVWVAGGLVLSTSLQAITTDNAQATPDAEGNPYAKIVERNLFALKPTPPAVDPANVKPPAPKIILNGLTTILGRRQVLFKVQWPARGGAAAKDESLVLSMGERQGEIEVLEVDQIGNSVKFDVSGTPQWVSLTTNVPSGPALPISQPGMPPIPTAGVPPPIPTYGVPPSAPTYGVPPSVPAYGAPPSTAAGVATRTIPTRTLRLPPAATPPQQPLSPEQQAAMMKVYEAAGGPPAPPTE